MVSTSTPLAEEPTPTDLLLATPPAILKLLTLTSPVIYSLTTFVQLLTWTHPSFFASLLVLLGWWTLCLFGTYLFKYGINLLILTYILYKYLSSSSTRAGASASHRHRQRSNALTPASYQALLSSAQVLATHVHSLKATLVHPLTSQLKFISHQAGKPVPAYTTAWFAVTSYPFYLALTYFVPLRFIFLAVGSFAILWNAPFFRTLRVALRKSAAVRWVARIVIAILSGGVGLRAEIRRTRTGLGVPGLLGKKKTEELIEERPVKSDVVDGSGGEDDVQLLFTCMENQRWWVGLDWTHALLPGERASWTDPALNPSSPPASFQLPPPSITYTPSPTRDDPNSRIKRTTEWKWLDPEWKVMLTTTSSISPTTTSAPSPLPTTPTDTKLPTSTTSASLSSATSASSIHSLEAGAPLAPLPLPKVDEPVFHNWQVDEEGWQYGDNHFEKMGPKGGLGKYTRRRAWVRRAGLVERAERVSGEKEKAKPTSGGVGGVGIGVPMRVGSLRERSVSGSREREKREKEKKDGGSSLSTATPSGAEVRRRKSSSGTKPVPVTAS